MLCARVDFGLRRRDCAGRSRSARVRARERSGLGFNLIAWSGNSGSSWTNAVNALYAAGFREVSISPVRRFDNNTGRCANSCYPPLSAVEAGVARAKQLGMRVTLNPFVELSNLPGGQSWRAYFAPLPGSTVANTFWPLYETYLDEVATIAQEHHVDAMNVGTEMKGLDSFFTSTISIPPRPAIKRTRLKRNWISNSNTGTP